MVGLLLWDKKEEKRESERKKKNTEQDQSYRLNVCELTAYLLYKHQWHTRIFPFTKKNISSLRAVKILFLSYTFEDIGLAMVTKKITIAMVI